LDDDLPVGCLRDDYDNDGNLRADVRTEGRPYYRWLGNDEIRDELEIKFGDPDLYDDVQAHLAHTFASLMGPRYRKHPVRRQPMRRCRSRARSSHRRVVVRVDKTVGGDSGDGDGEPAEPPSHRRAATIGGAL
jgi:hypothetical protein